MNIYLKLTRRMQTCNKETLVMPIGIPHLIGYGMKNIKLILLDKMNIRPFMQQPLKEVTIPQIGSHSEVTWANTHRR